MKKMVYDDASEQKFYMKRKFCYESLEHKFFIKMINIYIFNNWIVNDKILLIFIRYKQRTIFNHSTDCGFITVLIQLIIGVPSIVKWMQCFRISV